MPVDGAARIARSGQLVGLMFSGAMSCRLFRGRLRQLEIAGISLRLVGVVAVSMR